MIKAGTRRLARRYIGTREVVRVYQGAHLVWEKEPEPGPTEPWTVYDNGVLTINRAYNASLAGTELSIT